MIWPAFLFGSLFCAYPLFIIIKLLILSVGRISEDVVPQVNISGKLHEPPNSLKPYFVNAITNKTLTPSGCSVSSTILDLVRQQYIQISYSDESDAMGNRKREYFLTLLDSKAREVSKLSSLEQRLIAFVFQGSGNKVSFQEIKNYHIREAAVTAEFWKYWKEEIVYQMVKLGYIDKYSYYLRIYLKEELAVAGSAIVFVLLVLAIYMSEGLSLRFSIYFNNGPMLLISFLLPILSTSIIIILLRIFNLFSYKRTALGNSEYANWLAFQRWMEDYSVTKNYPIDSLILWEKYLVYGLSMGVSKKALSTLPINYNLLVNFVEGGFGKSGSFKSENSVLGTYDTSKMILEIISLISYIPKLFSKDNFAKESEKQV